MTPLQIFCLILALLLLYACYEFYELKCRKFVTYDIDLGLKETFVAVTDLHNKTLSKKDLKRIREAKPSCIFAAGDLLTAGDPDTKKALMALKELSDISDVYYSLGNHELRFRDEHKEIWEAFLKDVPANCHVLDDEHMSISEKAEVYGISLKRRNYKKGRAFDMSKEDTGVFKDVPENKVNILLAHNPDFIDYYDRVLPSDLIISGHLHGGFMRLPFVGGLVYSTHGIKHRDRGVYNGRHIVSSGAGEHLLPLRFFNRCEVVIIRS